jgi:ribosomal-protein-alanine N-acetyltransferase
MQPAHTRPAEGVAAVTFRFRTMRWRDIGPVASWRYPGPYAYYNFDLLSLATILLAQSLFGAISDPTYFTVVDEREQIVGVFSYIWHARGVLEVGLAMRPDLTGQGRGLGLSFVLAGLDYARKRFHPQHFYLTVATFNNRARTVYERAGFVRVGTTTSHRSGKRIELLEMRRDT